MKRILFPLILVLFTVSGVSAGLDEGLVFYFTFDNVKGRMVLDASDNQHDAEIVGKTKFVKGKYRNAIQITTNTEECVNVPDWRSLKISGEITMSAWVYRENWADGSGYWFDKGCYTGLGNMHAYDMAVFQVKEAHWHLGGLKEGTVIVMILGGARHQTRLSVRLPRTENKKWHHVVGTYDGAFMKIYLDGEFLFKSFDLSNEVFAEVNNEALRIGCAKDRPQYAFDNGSIDEVALWSRSLTQAEIRTVMKGSMLAVSPIDKAATTWADIKQRTIIHE